MIKTGKKLLGKGQQIQSCSRTQARMTSSGGEVGKIKYASGESVEKLLIS